MIIINNFLPRFFAGIGTKACSLWRGCWSRHDDTKPNLQILRAWMRKFKIEEREFLLKVWELQTFLCVSVETYFQNCMPPEILISSFTCTLMFTLIFLSLINRATNKSNVLLSEKLNSCQNKLKRAEERVKNLSQVEIEYEVSCNIGLTLSCG